MEDSVFDIAVIGAGIAGAAAAWALAGRHRVLLLEAEDQPGYHSTGRSVAILSRTYGSDQVRALTAASQSFLAAPPNGFAENPLLTPRGLLFAAGPDDGHRLDDLAARADAVGVSVRHLNAASALSLVPVLRPECLAAALYEPAAADIDVAALHAGFLRGARRRGTQLLCGARVASLDRSGGVWQIACGDRHFSALMIVNAAGAWADNVAELAGVAPVGISPLARTVATFDPAAEVDSGDWPMVMAADHTYYFKPDSGRVLASLSDEQPAVAGDVQPEELHLAELINRLEQATTMVPRRLHSRWAGLRSFAPDRNLVCGRDPAQPAFFWLAGQGGFGIQTAPAVAQLVAALVNGDALPEQLAAAGVCANALVPDRLRLSE
ncbi:FAD-binding oxidoreductase [Sphingomonas sp. So64.6b]|uniref:NAD(P)/FAD-dependent oxidoreductase n=1 Tax=Sphingomonas sp. So64.6b TaxID=2997354 RepID=UPI001601CED7|nr:FAD-dependent oxidoreductase [Sphingomonas sp. So64.6b]QNA85513.1 FAD-binding oxidoreductase [Sphingomonas sp. So64.6b]